MNNRLTQLLLAAVAVLLAFNLYVTTTQTVSAQTEHDRWRVMAVVPNPTGATALEAELNKGWNLHLMVAPENSHVIAVLQRAAR